MKTISAITSITVGEGTITIVAEVTDETLTAPAQQVTIGHTPSANLAFMRAMRVTSQAFQCIRNLANPVAMLHQVWADIAVALEPGQTWAPRFSTQPASATVAASATATFTGVMDTTDELPASSWVWSVSTNSGGTWTPITGATTPNNGQTAYVNYDTAVLQITGTVVGMSGYQYKCVATSAAGSTTSEIVTLTVTA